MRMTSKVTRTYKVKLTEDEMITIVRSLREAQTTETSRLAGKLRAAAEECSALQLPL